MTTETTNTTEAARALKARHRAMWAFGDYPAVVTDLVSPLGPVLAGACRIRVCRPGWTIGQLSWTPDGFNAQMFATMKPYAPPPPPGAQPPPLWGREEHVRALLGDQVADVTARRQTLRVDRFGRPEDFRD